jgi:hypothetical protein
MISILGAGASLGAHAGEEAAAPVSPVVVELFQSQGCSSCAPAQEDLNRLADRPDVLALSFSVTYWDSLGWKDTFASQQFTQRQYDYIARNPNAQVATPQVWINGRETVEGSDPARLAMLIAAGGPTGGPLLSVAGTTLRVGAAADPAGRADIWLVRYDPRNLEVAVRAGENKGKTLAHRDIVRQLIRIGYWRGTAQTLTLPPDKMEGTKTAVLVQAGAGGPILSAAKID